VGAANGWSFTALIQSIFGENQAVIESLQSDINYEVVSNTFEDLNFEVTALYADIESLVVIITVTSEKPIFDETHENSVAISGLLHYGSLETGWPEFKSCLIRYYVVDERQMTAVYNFTSPETDVYADVEYSLHFGAEEALFNSKHGILSFPILGGNAEVKFAVDTLSTQNLIHLYPDMSIESGAIISEIIVNPFGFTVYLDGSINDVLTSDIIGNAIYIEMIDGTRRNVMSQWMDSAAFYDGDDNTRDHYFMATFCYRNLIDIEKISTLVFIDVLIPLR
jgi:hypothetical protein